MDPSIVRLMAHEMAMRVKMMVGGGGGKVGLEKRDGGDENNNERFMTGVGSKALLY